MFFLSVAMMLASLGLTQFVRGPIGGSAPGVLDGNYVKETIPTKRVVPYVHIRESDVGWSKRVWSVIDLKQKINHPLYYPMDEIQSSIWNRNPSVWSLWTIIRHHVLSGDLTLYSPFNPAWEAWKDGDAFKYPITSAISGGNYYTDSLLRKELFIYLGEVSVDPFAMPLKSVLDPTEDSVVVLADGSISAVYPADDTLWFLSKDIVQYKIKEDWFFDKQRSVVDRRIIGIAPVVYQRDAAGNITGLRDLFWLYFPECRYVFQNFFVKSRQNDAQQMSLDDLFWKRMYHSYILKESNMEDREIESYKAGIDALIEAEDIKTSISTFEHDLWGY